MNILKTKVMPWVKTQMQISLNRKLIYYTRLGLLEIKNHFFKGTKGLIVLIFLNYPTGYVWWDLEVYAEILKLTNANCREFKSTSQIQGAKTLCRNVIKPIIA